MLRVIQSPSPPRPASTRPKPKARIKSTLADLDRESSVEAPVAGPSKSKHTSTKRSRPVEDPSSSTPSEPAAKKGRLSRVAKSGAVDRMSSENKAYSADELVKTSE